MAKDSAAIRAAGLHKLIKQLSHKAVASGNNPKSSGSYLALISGKPASKYLI
jgi:hypothetical protein